MMDWPCKHCGYTHEATPKTSLGDMGFRWIDETTSITTCAGCKSFTVQRAFDSTFTAGQFLVVKTKIKHYR